MRYPALQTKLAMASIVVLASCGTAGSDVVAEQTPSASPGSARSPEASIATPTVSLPDGWSEIGTAAEALDVAATELEDRGASASAPLMATYADLADVEGPVRYAATRDSGDGMLVVKTIPTSEDLDAAVERSAEQLREQGVDVTTTPTAVASGPAWLIERPLPPGMGAEDLRTARLWWAGSREVVGLEIVGPGDEVQAIIAGVTAE